MAKEEQIKTIIDLTGEKEYRAACTNINSSLREIGSEMKLTTAEFANNADSTEALTAKQKLLHKQFDEQAKKAEAAEKALEKMRKAGIDPTDPAFQKMQTNLNNTKTDMVKVQREIDDTSQKLRSSKVDWESVGDTVGKVGKAVGKACAAMGAAIGAIGAAFFALAEETRAARENMGKLETGFVTAGHSAEDAANTYNELYGILGDDGQATEAAAHLAKLTNNQAELAEWTNIATGVYATFGDSLPIENLTEAANETAKTGAITGGLADALNWAGVSEDKFQASLDACSSEQERQALITSTLNGLYSEAADRYRDVNGDIIDAQKATAKLSAATAKLGAIAEPIITTLKVMAAELLDEITPFISLIGEGLTGALTGAKDGAKKLSDGMMGIISFAVEKLTDILPEFIKTGIKVITNIVKGIANSLPKLVPAIVDAAMMMVKTLVESIPLLIDAGIELVLGLAEGVIKAIPEIIRVIPTLVQSIVNALIDGIPLIIEGAVELFRGIISAIPTILADLAIAVPQIISSVVTGLLAGVGEVISAAAELFFGIVDEGRKAREEIKKNAEAVSPFVDALKAATPDVANYSALLSDYGRTLSDIDTAISNTETAITTILATALQNQEGLRREDIENIRAYMDDINALQQEKLQIYRDQQVTALRKLQLDKGTLQQEDAAQHIANTEAALAAANTATEEAYTAQLTIIENKYKAMGDIGSAAYYTEQEAARAYYKSQLDENQAYADQALEIVVNQSQNWLAADAEKYDQLNTLADQYITADKERANAYDPYTMSRIIASSNDAATEYKQTLAEMDLDSANAFLSMAATVKAGGGEIEASTAETASKMLSAFDGLPTELDGAGKDALLGMIAGMEEYIPELSNASNMTANEIVTAIKTALGIASPSLVLSEIGGYAIQGLIAGMTAEQAQLSTAMTQVTDTIKAAFETLPKDICKVCAEAAIRIVKSISEGIGDNIKTISEAVKTIVEKVITGLTAQAQRFNVAGQDICKHLATGMIMATVQITAKIPQITQSILTALVAQHPKIYAEGVSIDRSVAAGMVSGIPEITAKIPQIVQPIIATLRGFVSEMTTAGEEMVRGIWQGFENLSGWLESKVRNMMQNIVAATKNEMQIASPSKVFAGIGEYMAAGLAEGFAREMKGVEGMIRRETANAVPQLTSGNETQERRNTAPTVEVIQNIYAFETSYAKQQREAARQFRQIAREVMA